ncbi:hypothetical protein D3P06_02170 [Paracoccus aestuarii]|uniref:Uncharacterized protein n=1 Tax=Paracoccus aestuarii TaxID=453842 RepID=A0A419A1N8_9RHOB|nr:hypothetical protein D3P06_02170 [Paracoccus aestuarii]
MRSKLVHDATFDDHAAFGSERWVAARFGRSPDWLRKTRSKLEVDGFPPPDPIVGFTLKADVDAWLSKRRRVADPARSQEYHHQAQRADLSKL